MAKGMKGGSITTIPIYVGVQKNGLNITALFYILENWTMMNPNPMKNIQIPLSFPQVQ